MAAILDLTHNAMTRVLSGHTSMSGVPKNLKIDIKIMNLRVLSIENDINLMFDLGQMAAILENGGHQSKATTLGFMATSLARIDISHIAIHRYTVGGLFLYYHFVSYTERSSRSFST